MFRIILFTLLLTGQIAIAQKEIKTYHDPMQQRINEDFFVAA